ncbi:MAG: L-2-hydroxyglutarate oxidase, partial [Phycisphaerales bacterium]|nr:L-2-hydroxyglutarate oxidase [Phycisphaerales bacterium]
MTDLVVIGAGIVGLATAHRYLERHPGRSVVVLEKEDDVAAHQTGHNSGVIHSGIYYKPGSLKARNCTRGRDMMIDFARTHDIAHDMCGKVIVATLDEELPRLESIFERGRANGVRCEMIGRERLRELEPHAAGLRAIHVHDAGIIDYRGVAARLRTCIEAAGGSVRTSTAVRAIRPGEAAVVVEHDHGTERADRLVNCAGLQSDRVTMLSQGTRPARIVPFKGEYYELTPEAKGFCSNLIYPVPDPNFPFLGVHFTRMIGGLVECGPNAVFSLDREGYSGGINPADVLDAISYPAFWSIALRYWRTGAGEVWRSISKQAFVRALQRLVPEIREEHLGKATPGIRAQALTPDGRL